MKSNQSKNDSVEFLGRLGKTTGVFKSVRTKVAWDIVGFTKSQMLEYESSAV